MHQPIGFYQLLTLIWGTNLRHVMIKAQSGGGSVPRATLPHSFG